MAESQRPYRHLCPEAFRRDAMTTDKFWEQVAKNLGINIIDEPMEPDLLADLEQQLAPEPCTVCGESGACAYDAEGRPMIHAQEGRDD